MLNQEPTAGPGELSIPITSPESKDQEVDFTPRHEESLAGDAKPSVEAEVEDVFTPMTLGRGGNAFVSGPKKICCLLLIKMNTLSLFSILETPIPSNSVERSEMNLRRFSWWEEYTAQPHIQNEEE